MAQPETRTAPDTVEPGPGVSMKTLGGVAATVMVTLAEPVSGAASLSVAETRMVWEPGLSVEVLS